MNIKKSPTEENLANILEVREESPEPARQQRKLSSLEQHHPRREIRLRYFSWLFIIALIYFSLLMGFWSMACEPSGGIGGIIGVIIWGIFFGIVILIASPVSLIIIFISFITLIFSKFNIKLIWLYGIIFSTIGFIISFCIAFTFNFRQSCTLNLW